jgi:hypothetical protein
MNICTAVTPAPETEALKGIGTLVATKLSVSVDVTESTTGAIGSDTVKVSTTLLEAKAQESVAVAIAV